MAEADKKTGIEQKSGGGSIDGIIENKSAESAPVASEPSAEKNDFSGAATVDPVEELLKKFLVVKITLPFPIFFPPGFSKRRNRILGIGGQP